MSDKDDAGPNGRENDRAVENLPTPMQLCQIAVSLLHEGILKPDPDVDTTGPSYHEELDPLVYHPNYRQAVLEAMKVWQASVEILETHCPDLFAPLFEIIFEAPEIWEEKYRFFTNQGWRPDEVLFCKRWSFAAVAEGVYSGTKYTPLEKQNRLKKLVARSRRGHAGRWVMGDWERKLLADPFGRNNLVPSPIEPAVRTEDSKQPEVPIADFNGIEIRALIEMRTAAKSVSASEAGKAGGRPKKKS